MILAGDTFSVWYGCYGWPFAWWYTMNGLNRNQQLLLVLSGKCARTSNDQNASQSQRNRNRRRTTIKLEWMVRDRFTKQNVRSSPTSQIPIPIDGHSIFNRTVESATAATSQCAYSKCSQYMCFMSNENPYHNIPKQKYVQNSRQHKMDWIRWRRK